MSVYDSISDYNSTENVYNKYISELEALSKSDDKTQEKCKKIFEANRPLLEKIDSSVASGAPSIEQIDQVLSMLKGQLHRKTCELAEKIIESELDLLNPDIFKNFSRPLRSEIAKCFAAKKGSRLLDMIKDYEITDQDEICELIKTKISRNSGDTYGIVQNFEKYGITDQQKRFEITKYIASSPKGHYILLYYWNFKFLNPSETFELMKIIVQYGRYSLRKTPDLIECLKKFIKDPKEMHAIVCLLVSRKNFQEPDYILSLLKLNQDQRFQLAQIAAKVHKDNPTILFDCIRAWEIADLDQLNQLYQIVIDDRGWETFKLAAAQSDFSIFKTALNFIPDDQKRQELSQSYFCNIRDKKKLRENFTSLNQISEVLSPLAFGYLKVLAIQSGMPSTIIESMESRLAGHGNPLQREKDIVWLGMLLMHYLLDPNLTDESPLFDAKTLPLLASIWKITDTTLRNEATRALISVYKSPEKKEMVKNLVKKNKKYLDLVILFSVQARIDVPTMTNLLTGLGAAKYKDTAIITPIIEILCALSTTQLLSIEKKQELLMFVFNPPVQGPREPRPDFNDRLAKYRQDQQNLIAALHSLLYFHQETLLNEIKDSTMLVDKWKTFMGETFHIDGDILPQFMKIFGQSTRYPNALFIYATRLQTLPKQEINQVMPLLGKFASSVLNGTYPQIRYDFTNNPHLQTVFSKNENLLEKWQTSLPIKINQAAQEMIQNEESQQQIERLTRKALSDHHLGKDQETVYPELTALLSRELKLPKIHPEADEQELKRTNIVQQCGVLLNPKSDLFQLKTALGELQKLLPNDVQFKQDVNNMLKQLSLPQSSSESWTILDTDAWIDMLLMGTEVDSSCQGIKSNPDDNKCLLSYILDGKTRIMIAADPSGKIVGRAVLRILWDAKQKKPVLFVERLYIHGENYKSKQQAILEGCKQKAQVMGIPLVASAPDYRALKADKYPETLLALGGPVPYEYVDALVGIQKDGIYSIKESVLLWSPPSTTV